MNNIVDFKEVLEKHKTLAEVNPHDPELEDLRAILRGQALQKIKPVVIPEETHRAIKVIDPTSGRVRKVFCRTQALVDKLAQERLGDWGSETVLQDSEFSVIPWGIDFARLVVSYNIARRVIATAVQRSQMRYRVILGSDVLHSYLEKQDDYYGAYELDEKLFILFGYCESKNRRISELVNELVAFRYHKKLSVWVFVPESLEVMTIKWGPAMQALSYLTEVKVTPNQTPDLLQTEGPKSVVESVEVVNSTPSDTSPEGNVWNASRKKNNKRSGKR